MLDINALIGDTDYGKNRFLFIAAFERFFCGSRLWTKTNMRIIYPAFSVISMMMASKSWFLTTCATMRATLFQVAIAFALALTLSSCASGPSLEELELEAMKTGDWTAYEAKKARNAADDARAAATKQCRDRNKILYCEQWGRIDYARDCTCIDSIRGY